MFHTLIFKYSPINPNSNNAKTSKYIFLSLEVSQTSQDTIGNMPITETDSKCL